MTLFSNIEPVRFAGHDAKGEFAYRVYDKDRRVLGKSLQEWLKPAVCRGHGSAHRRRKPWPT
jgi:xylose isomerase